MASVYQMINVYTEEDAKKKKCLSKVHNGDCITSECMAWRYVETLNPKTLLFVEVAGYCGLAGKPECQK